MDIRPSTFHNNCLDLETKDAGHGVPVFGGLTKKINKRKNTNSCACVCVCVGGGNEKGGKNGDKKVTLQIKQRGRNLVGYLPVREKKEIILGEKKR